MEGLNYELHYKNIGNRTRSLRNQRGWSQSDLGGKADLEKSAVQRIERGCNSTLKTLLQLTTAFELSLSDLLTLQPDKSNPT